MKKYEMIYADPPWRYRSGKVQGAAINHYATMSDEELYQLPVAEIAADNCIASVGNLSKAPGSPSAD